MVLALVMLVMLPESLQFLTLHAQERKNGLRQLRAWLKRFDPEAPGPEGTRYEVREEVKKGVPIVHLFHEGRASGTLLIWVINFMNLLNLYFLSNWLPTVVKDAGFPTQTAVLVGASLQLAGVFGAFLLGWCIHKRGFVPVLATGFFTAACAIAWIGHPGLALVPLFTVVCIAGLGIVGGQSGMNAMSATYYPTDLRATGVGAGLGVGRMGAIVGPVVAGQLLALHWSAQKLFLVAAVPAVISALFMLCMRPALKTTQTKPTGVPVAVH
jgi:AAHS family 4-hydroxybenzoate transporter-like MFS transporter